MRITTIRGPEASLLKLGSRLGRNVIDPVPTQCVVVDLEFPRRPFDRRTGSKQPLDPRAFEVLASLTAPCARTLFSHHRFPPYPISSKRRSFFVSALKYRFTICN